MALKGIPLGFRALVDTGSPWTVITPMGAEMLKMRVRFKLDKIPQDTPDVTFAGGTFRRYETNFEVCIKDTKKKIINFKKPNPTTLKAKGRFDYKEFKHIPIIIGCDFLEANGLILQFNPANNTAFLRR